MADIAVGSFFGYREFASGYTRTPRLRPKQTPAPIKLSISMVEHLGVSGFDYRTFAGDAPAEFGNWIPLPWNCRMAKWTLRGGPLDVQFSFDGETVGDQRLLRTSTTTLDSFIAFRVRVTVPGFLTWYQLVAIL